MTQYPRDEFDDVPEDSQRRGAYRGREKQEKTSSKGFIAILVAGCLSLLVGALMFIYQPRNLSPEASASSASSAPAAESASPTAEAREGAAAQEVEIYNGGAYVGAATEAQRVVEEQGYTVTTTDNWQGVPVTTSVLFYSAGKAAEANALADSLGIALIEEDPAAQVDFYAVLGPDYTGTSQSSGQASADTGTGTGADAGTETGTDAGYGNGAGYIDPNQAGGYTGQ